MSGLESIFYLFASVLRNKFVFIAIKRDRYLFGSLTLFMYAFCLCMGTLYRGHLFSWHLLPPPPPPLVDLLMPRSIYSPPPPSPLQPWICLSTHVLFLFIISAFSGEELCFLPIAFPCVLAQRLQLFFRYNDQKLDLRHSGRNVFFAHFSQFLFFCSIKTFAALSALLH